MNKKTLDKLQTTDQSRTSGKISTWVWIILAVGFAAAVVSQGVAIFSQLTNMM